MMVEFVVTDEGHGSVRGAAVVQVAHRQRLYRHIGHQRRIEQLRKETTQASAIGGGPFREHQYCVPELQAVGNFQCLAAGLAAAPLDEQGTHGAGQGAD